MSVRTRDAWAYWLVPINLTGIPGYVSDYQFLSTIGPDGTLDTGVPGYVTYTPTLYTYGLFTIEDIEVPTYKNIDGLTELHCLLMYVDELKTRDFYGELTEEITADTDNPFDDAASITWALPATLTEPEDDRFNQWDFVVFNDKDEDTVHTEGVVGNALRKYEVAQILRRDGDTLYLRRQYPGAGPDPPHPYAGQRATSETWKNAHAAGTRFYCARLKHFMTKIKRNSFETAEPRTAQGLPPRFDMVWPSMLVVAPTVSLANYYGFGPWTTTFVGSRFDPESEKTLHPPAPGMRVLAGQAYLLPVAGELEVGVNASIPVKVQDAATIRAIYAYVQFAPIGADILIDVKVREPQGDWEVLERLTIRNGEYTSYDEDNQPKDRRMPYSLEWPVNTMNQDWDIGIDIVQVGSVTKGYDLMVTLQT
jgi:hypothetical protein